MDIKPNFEEELEKLEACAVAINKEGATLEESIAAFEEGAKLYKSCKAILDEATQRIEIIGEETKDGDE